MSRPEAPENRAETPTRRCLRPPRLVACDLDGTLLRPDHTLSSRTRTALRHLDALGVPFVVVTGRAIGAWQPTARRLRLTRAVVCANGAMVLDTGGRVLLHRPIPPAVLSAALTALRRSVPDAVVAVERDGELLHEVGYPRPAEVLVRPTRVVTTAELIADPVSKLLVRSTTRPDAVWPAAVARVHEEVTDMQALADKEGTKIKIESGYIEAKARLLSEADDRSATCYTLPDASRPPRPDRPFPCRRRRTRPTRRAASGSQSRSKPPLPPPRSTAATPPSSSSAPAWSCS